MSRRRYELALELLKPSDWERFENFASAFLVVEWPELRTLASPTGDGGRDATLWAPKGEATVAIQYSVTQDWVEKIRKTAKTVNENYPDTRVLVYVSNQVIGARADRIIRQIREKYGIFLDVRDRNWFLERVINSDTRTEIAEQLAIDIVDPYIHQDKIIDGKPKILTDKEAQATLIYLGLQWEDDTRKKGLTRLCFEAIAKSVLRNTSTENRMSREKILAAIRKLLPSHPPERLDTLANSALNRLSGKSIRHYSKDDSFCLSHEERERIAIRLSELEIEDIDLKNEITNRVISYFRAKPIEDSEIETIHDAIRQVIERFLFDQGENFAASIKDGSKKKRESGDINSLIIRHANENPNVSDKKDKIEAVIYISIDVLNNPGPNASGYLRNIADSYTLMAFLRETPDIQGAVNKIFAHGEIWLDTSIVLPLIAEQLKEISGDKISSIVKAAIEAGMKLFVTKGVIQEVERHINRCLACHMNTVRWEGRVPFLYSVYVSTGRSADSFPTWIELFCGSSRPEEDITMYLHDVFDIGTKDLHDEVELVDEKIRIAVKEEWISIQQKRRGGERDGDDLTMLRLAEHDMENYVGVLGRRTQEPANSSVGYSAWWLTLDSEAHRILPAIKARLEHQIRVSPVLSPDFLINYLAFGPSREQITKTTEAALRACSP